MIKKAGLLAAVIFIVASCAVITVNVYFPEKDVKQAYTDLEKELMKPDSNAAQPDQDKKPESQPRENSGEQKPAPKPETSMRLEFIGSAYAQDSGLAQKIADTVRKMPDVVAAYKEIGAAIPELDRLRTRGAVGEGNNGLLVPREGTMSPADRQLVDIVNKDRKIVINGMAKAIVRINRQPENPDTLQQVIPQATEQFATIRRDSAKKGWWIQDSNGIWSKK
ncbi:MAG: DUF1318 domain-containing protein [Nitrospirae bacterium]|nr:DUF1318 domain-containing protein [Nitrospirota bacterium]